MKGLIMRRYHGKNDEFKRTIERDIALVNKACDFLKDEHSVPVYWRQDLNKNMTKTEDGRWVFTERPISHDGHQDLDSHLEELGLLSSNKSINQ